MTLVLNVILPIFAVLAAGYVAARFRVFDEAASQVLSRFVYYVAGPALVFISLSRTDVGEFFNLAYLGALGGGMALTMGFSVLVAIKFFPGSPTNLGFHGLSAMYSSTAYIGIPLLLAAYGDAALVPAIIGAVITGAVFLPIGIVIAEFDRGHRDARGLGKSLFSAATNPWLTSTIAGLGVSAIGLTVPGALTTFFEMLGDAFGPCALFAAGLFIGSRRIREGTGEVGWLVFVKLILHPLITWWLAYEVLELDGVWAAAAVIHAALPSGVPVFVVAQRYATYVERSSATIVVSTTISVVTLSVLIVVL